MRIQVELDDQLVAQIDKLSGPEGRSDFVRQAVVRAVQQTHRWSEIQAAAGGVDDEREWDGDPADGAQQRR